MTVGKWLEMWYNTYVQGSSRISPSTQGMYRRSVEAAPAWLCALELCELTPVHCFTWIKHVAAKHPRAAQLDRVMLSRALRVAVKCGLRPPIVIDEDTCPKPEYQAKKADVLTAEQAAAYARAACGSEAAPLLLLCLCGLRRGEALGVRWQDVDLRTGVLRVVGQRQVIDRAYVYKALKTEHSRREIILPDEVLALIAAWPRRLTSRYLCDITPGRLRAEHLKVLKKAELPAVTLHGLRHTFATLAAADGVSMKLLQLALGHANYQLTADLYADHLQTPSNVQTVVWQGLRPS